jgi:sugar/nucleoside kinase (ribokinase family)
MTATKYDVLGIGNAIFDVLVQTDERFLAQHGMTKGGMSLIDEDRATAIYRDMGPATEMSGGSAANTIVGVANLGARAAYIGKMTRSAVCTPMTFVPPGSLLRPNPQPAVPLPAAPTFW